MVGRLLALFAGEEVEVDSALRSQPVVEGWDAHPLIEQLDQELALRGYSRRTRKNYRLHAVRYLR